MSSGFVALRDRAHAVLAERGPLSEDDLVAFVGTERPIFAQEARTAWEYLAAEARRLGRTLVEPPLIDLNALADHVLALEHKPTLALVAERLGIGVVRAGHPDEEV